MRTVLLGAVAVAVSCVAAEIPSGNHVLLRMQNTVNSKSARVGDYVYMQTATPVSVDGKILIPNGSFVQGKVAGVRRPGRVKGRAALSLLLETVTLPSGQKFRFEPRVASVDGDNTGQRVGDKEGTIQQASSVGHDVGQVAIMAGSGAITGAFIGRAEGGAGKGAGIGAGAGTAVGLATSLLTRGNDVMLRQGSSLDVVFDRAVSLQ